MKVQFKIWFLVLLIAGFMAGCGCGGDEENPLTLVSIKVTPADSSIALGMSQQFTATGTFSDGSTQDITTSATWSSSDTSVSAISNAAGFQGLAQSTAVGSTFITATSGSVLGTTTLTVTPAALISIKVAPINPSVALGTSQQFTATGSFSDKTIQDITTSVTWSSSNIGVATISDTAGSKGLAKSIAVGSTGITATFGVVSDSTTLTVTPAILVSLKVSPVNPGVPLGMSQQFSATGTFSDGTTQDITTSVTWSSSNPLVASISNTMGSKGLAKSIAVGSTGITATSGSISDATTLTVRVKLVSITVTPINPYVGFGAVVQFTATGTFSDGTTQNITTSVTWSSSDTTVATISNAAGSKGLATTDHVRGRTTITATLEGISGSTDLIDP